MCVSAFFWCVGVAVVFVVVVDVILSNPHFDAVNRVGYKYIHLYVEHASYHNAFE